MSKSIIDVKAIMEAEALKEQMGITPEVQKQISFIDGIIEGQTLTTTEEKFISDMKARITQYKELTKKQSEYLGVLLLKLSRMKK